MVKPFWNNAQRVNHQTFAKKTHTCAKKNLVPRAVLMKSGLVSVNTTRQVNVAHSKTTVNAARPMSYLSKTAHLTVKRPIHKNTAFKNSNINQRVNTVKGKKINTAKPKAVVNAVKGNNFNAVKASACWVWKPKHKVLDHGNPQMDLQDQGVIDSGCSRHMTGNMSYLTDYEEIDGGYVAFGGNPKGGKITGKGTIKTGNLDFENVYFVRELKFNLFSVSQMCDKKNSVLFNDTECIVLSPNFKLIDESQVLLRVPRKNNMYSVDLKNIVPKGGLTCLFAKATSDESKLWHRRLGHLNFKTMNKLVKGNLVRGLPSKLFENDQTCVACQKGKQHRASSTKDETSGILKSFITGIENLVYHKVKVIRCDNGAEFKNREMNQFYEMKGILRHFSVAKTPQQNGVTKRRNRTLIEAARTMLADSKLPTTFWAEAVNTACYVQNRVKAFRVFNTRTRIVEENLHIRFSESTPNVVGSGPDWLFDIDALTRTMNYEPIVAGAQSNSFACRKASDNADPKSSHDDGSKPSSDDEKKVDEDPRKDSDYDKWRLRIESYIQLQDYALWEIIEEGNSFKPVARTTTNADGTSTLTIPGVNVGFVSTPSSTNDVNRSNVFVNTASSSLSTTSSTNNTARLSDATIYAFLANKPNGSQVFHEDLEQIHEDDLEEMDLKWQLALLSMKARKFYQRTGKKIIINRSDTAGYDKTKSYMTKEEVPTNFALMAFPDSDVLNNKTCSKTCLKSFEDLKSQHDNLRIELNKSKFDLANYKRGLASVEEQLVFYKKNKGSQISDNNRNGVGYNAVAPPPIGLFAPLTIDLSNFGLEEFKQPEFEGCGVKVKKNVSENSSNKIKKTSGAPIIEDWVSDSDEDETMEKVSESANVQKSMQADQPRKVSQNPRNNNTNWNTPMSKKLGVGFQFTPKACFVCGSFNHLIKDYDFHDKKMVQKPVLYNVKKRTVLTKSGLVPISTARQSSSRAATPVSTARPINTVAPKPFVNSVNTAKGKRVTSSVGEQGIDDVKSKACWVWRPKLKVLDHVSKNSGSYIWEDIDDSMNILSVLVVYHTRNGHQFTMSNRHQELASPEQTVSGKDFSNLLIVDSLLKTIWFINAPCFCNEALAIPGQTATDKELSNPLMAGSLPKTTLPPKLLE
ncbi:putative ribonuclease H-like domain-containing protein [Tanacetum coccineum]